MQNGVINDDRSEDFILMEVKKRQIRRNCVISWIESNLGLNNEFVMGLM